MARKYPISGVYQIQSKVKPKRIYVGSSKDVYARWTDHLLYLRKGEHHSKKHTEEANEKRRQFMLANPRTREAREKQSASLIKYHERRKMEKELETQMNYSHAV